MLRHQRDLSAYIPKHLIDPLSREAPDMGPQGPIRPKLLKSLGANHLIVGDLEEVRHIPSGIELAMRVAERSL
jgi:hypothetical protein